jgi:hypothetical protein
LAVIGHRRLPHGPRTAQGAPSAAESNLFGRLLSSLHHCLTTGQHYDEATAFPATKLPRAA